MAIQLVAQVAGGAASAYTTPPIDTRLANFILVMGGAGNNFDPNPSNSMGDGASYASITSVHYASGGYQTCKFRYMLNPAVDAAHTFTLVQAAQNPCLAVMAFSGVGAAPFDQEGALFQVNNNSWPFPSFTPGQANELIILGAVSQVAGVSVDSGFTGLFGSSPGTWQPTLAYKVQTSLKIVAPTVTPGSWNAVVGKMVSFKAADASFNPAWARDVNRLA
jgi:hypothetical protein